MHSENAKDLIHDLDSILSIEISFVNVSCVTLFWILPCSFNLFQRGSVYDQRLEEISLDRVLAGSGDL